MCLATLAKVPCTFHSLLTAFKAMISAMSRSIPVKIQSHGFFREFRLGSAFRDWGRFGSCSNDFPSNRMNSSSCNLLQLTRIAGRFADYFPPCLAISDVPYSEGRRRYVEKTVPFLAPHLDRQRREILHQWSVVKYQVAGTGFIQASEGREWLDCSQVRFLFQLWIWD